MTANRFRFRVPHFKRDGSFDRFTYWGRISDGEFASPASDNFTTKGMDCQSTGLTDKNGVAIFEGDILSYTVFDYEDRDTQFIGEVKWLPFMTSFIVTQIPDSLMNGDWGLGLGWIEQQDCELEVIGNIYENPELISN